MKEKFYPLKSMTKKEFIAHEKGFEEGLINVYQHIQTACKVLIRNHRKNLTVKRLNEFAEMNKHLWKESK